MKRGRINKPKVVFGLRHELHSSQNLSSSHPNLTCCKKSLLCRKLDKSHQREREARGRSERSGEERRGGVVPEMKLLWHKKSSKYC